ncbi:DUF2130 domain-containing protein [Mycoplasma phocimorsus]|uniref:DUF2130 domain-containing protein n=1 Tax=Mycoplasma phocimorsus TaxID=3045839 RepID=UPI0024BF28CF|nr:DUF2130 domain-containing protein [Mycoplasma phocimorsus]MDJ1648778.1 DUF2130 domain-containing protein [Mycoplasma phocimorsus]
MNKKEIKCPNCLTIFKIDEEQYALILQQISNKEFNEQLEAQKKDLEKNYNENIKRIKEQNKKDAESKILILENQIKSLEKEREMLKASADSKIQLEIKKIEDQYREKDNEIFKQKTQIKMLNQKILDNEESQKKYLEKALEAQKKSDNLEFNKILNDLNQQLRETNFKKEKLEKDLDNINEKNDLLTKNKINELKNEHNNKINILENKNKLLLDEIEMYKNFKAKQSVKLIGESLEKHCESEFMKVKALGFKNAVFIKDNEIADGTKGDFIYRDYEDGIEFISIMFEMKNELENSLERNKKRNKDFFEKLHKDRIKKNCEYAILVSMLEQDDETYNTGIVDVSTPEFPKMFVIRPQFFIQIISLLKNAALNSLKIKKELEENRQRNIDLTKFEDNINKFKVDFGSNTEKAAKNFEKAIKEINAAIEKLTNTRDELVKSGKQLRFANDKVQNISLKKLTKDCENIKRQIEEK